MQDERRRPATGRGSREKSIINRLREANRDFNWDILPLSGKSPSPQRTNDNDPQGVHLRSVTKRSYRRQRQQRSSRRTSSMLDDNLLRIYPRSPHSIGYEDGDISDSPNVEDPPRHPATSNLPAPCGRGCSAPPARRNIQDSSKPKQPVEDIGSRDDLDAGIGERSPGAGSLSLNGCLEAEGCVLQAEKASGALSSGDEGGSNESTEWHSCSSSVLVATQDRQYRERSADIAGDASDDSSQWGDFHSARWWTQGVKASAGRRRRFVPDDSETSDNDHVAVDNVSVKPFDLCEQFKKKVALEGETCPGQEEVTKGLQSEQENVPHEECSGSDRETGVFGDAQEPQSTSVAQADSPCVSSTTKPTAPGDSSVDDAVPVRRKLGKQRRFVVSEDDSDSDEPVLGRIDKGMADLNATAAAAAAAAAATSVASRCEPNHVVAKIFPIESSVLVTASAPSRASSGGKEHIGCGNKSPAPLNNLGVRKNRRISPSSIGGGSGGDYDEDDEYAGVIRKTPGKTICSRRRFVLESSDDSSAEERVGKCDPIIETATSRVSPLLDVVATADVPPSLVEGVAATSARPSPFRSEEGDYIGEGDCVQSSESASKGDGIHREDFGFKKNVAASFGSGDKSEDSRGSFALPEAVRRPADNGLRKPRSRKLDRGDSRHPTRRHRNVLEDSNSSDENDSVHARSLRSEGDVRARNDPLGPGRRRLMGSTLPPLAKPAWSPENERRWIDASHSDSMSSDATPSRLGCSPVGDENPIACSSIGSGIDEDGQGRGRSTELLSKGSRRIPTPRGRVPRQRRTGIGVGDGVEPPSVALDFDGGASSRDSIPRGGWFVKSAGGSRIAGGLTSPSRRPRARRQNGMGRRSACVQISEESAKKELSGSAFSKARDSLTAKYFAEFNDGAFGGRLSDVKVTWNTRLSRTAGVTKSFRRSAPFGGFTYVSAVELSTKVVDSESKLRETLLHELCHAAAWVIDHKSRPPHGDHFWAWARKAKAAHPGVPITTCHSYDINFKYRYVCVGPIPDVEGGGCGAEIGRHSKSIDVTKQVCGRCKGRLVLLGTHGKDGKLKKPRAATDFSLFVKKHYAEVKSTMPTGTPQREVMKEISSRWAARDKGGRHLDDPDSIVDSMKTLSLLHEPLTNTARASTTLASERGKRVDSYSGDKENADDGLIDLT